MKKVLIGIFAVASMALIGCSQEEQLAVMNDSSEVYTGIMEVSESRTSLGEDGNVIWSDNDVISIFKKSGYHQKYQVEKGGSTIATFKYANESQKHNASLGMNYAVYPYNSGHSIDNNGTFTLNLSSLATQAYTEGTFENGQSVMVAKSNNNDLTFFNTLAMLRVKLCSEVPGEYSINSITLTSASKALNGTATIDMSQDKQPAVFNTNGNKTITLNCSSPIMLEDDCVYDSEKGIYTGGHDFYILIPADTYPAKDLTIKVEGKDLNGAAIVYEAEYPEPLVLERSSITTIHHAFEEEDWRGSIEGEYNEASGLYWNGNSAAHKSVYYIYNASDLQKAASYFTMQAHSSEANKVTFELEGDIDMTDIAWKPWSVMFITLNANNHTISNLSNSLFGYAGAVTINDLTLENVSATGNQAGTFAASAEGTTMTNCYLKGNNTVTYVDASKNENGVGAITGVCVQCNLNVTIETGTSVIINKGNIADTEKTSSESILYGYKHTTYTTNSGTITNNGNVRIGISTSAGLVAIGGTRINGDYVLMDDLDMAGYEMKPIEISSGANVTFNGNGYTISNLTLGAANIHGMTGTGNEVAGLFDLTAPATTVSLTVDDLTFKNAIITCNGYAGVVAGYNSNGSSSITLNNVDVKGATVTAETVASLVGYTTGNVNLTNCDVEDLTLTGETGRPEKVGAFIGTANTATCAITTTNCTNNTTYNDYGRVINGATWNGATIVSASTQTDLDKAVSSSSNVDVTLTTGNYSLPSVSNGEVSISGTTDVVITINKPAYHSSDVTLNGVTVKGSGYATGIQHVKTVKYNDVTIQGEMCLYGEKVIFNNCTFELDNQYIWTYGAKNVEFTNCTFNTNGKAILIYNEGAGASNVTVKGCTFNATASAKASAIANQNCSAIEIDNYQSSGTGAAHVLITENNTYSNNFSGEWRIKSYTVGNNVTVNNVVYTSIAIDGKTMTIDANKNVTINK